MILSIKKIQYIKILIRKKVKMLLYSKKFVNSSIKILKLRKDYHYSLI